MRRASSRRRWKFVSRAQHATRRGGDSAVLTRGQSKDGVSGEGIGFSFSPLPGSDVRDSSAPHVRLRAGIPLAPRDRVVSRSQRLTRTSSRLRRWCSSGSKSAVARLGDVTKLNAQIERRSVEVLAACRAWRPNSFMQSRASANFSAASSTRAAQPTSLPVRRARTSTQDLNARFPGAREIGWPHLSTEPLLRAGRRTFWAPGHVNLIGEHTDFSGGLVLPAAIKGGESGTSASRLVASRRQRSTWKATYTVGARARR